MTPLLERTIQCGDRDVTVTVKRSRRRRTVALSVQPPGLLTIHVPYFVWGRQTSASLAFWAGPLIDRFVRKQAAWIFKKLDFYQQKAVSDIPSQSKVWCRSHLESRLAEPVARYSQAMALSPKSVTVSHPKSRWGSCSARGELRLSSRLAMVPQTVFEYVIVHELAHMKELNHSPRFWAVVREHCPDYRAQRRWLRHQGWAARWSDE